MSKKLLTLTEAAKIILARYGREYTARQLRRFITDGVDGRFLDAYRLPSTSRHRSSPFRLSRKAIDAFFAFVPDSPEPDTMPDPEEAKASVRPFKITKRQKRDIDEARRLCGLDK